MAAPAAGPVSVADCAFQLVTAPARISSTSSAVPVTRAAEGRRSPRGSSSSRLAQQRSRVFCSSAAEQLRRSRSSRWKPCQFVSHSVSARRNMVRAGRRVYRLLASGLLG